MYNNAYNNNYSHHLAFAYTSRNHGHCVYREVPGQIPAQSRIPEPITSLINSLLKWAY